jgi:FixJ family two-component response regulator
MPENSLIAIVDDEDSVRDAIRSLLRSVGFQVEVFASAERFLASDRLRETACLVLDVRMPGMDGEALMQQLAAAQFRIPVIFMSAHGDERVRVLADSESVVAFLCKPFREDVLLDAVRIALRIGPREGHVRSKAIR